MQRKLDKSIIKNHNLQNKNLIKEKIIALLVEVGEFANEYAIFKYWKKNKNINREKILEEFVDGIHFFGSLFLELNIENANIYSKTVSDDKNEQLLATFRAISKLESHFNANTFLEAFRLYLGNAKLLDLSEEEIQEHYIAKNKINFERIANNY